MKFLIKQDWENLLSKLYLNNNTSSIGKDSKSRIEKIFFDVSQKMQEIIYSKQMSHTIYGIAMTLFHYIVCFNSNLKSIDFIEIPFACFYMATKIQFFDFNLKELIKDYKENIKKNNLNEKKNDPDFIKYEIQLYSQLGYDLDIETPYQIYYNMIPILCNKFQGIKDKFRELKVFCFNLINDTYIRPLSLYFHPKIIFWSCFIFSIKFLEINDVDLNKLIEGENHKLIAECMEHINDIYSKYIE